MNLTINAFDDNGNVTGSREIEFTKEQLEDIVSAACQVSKIAKHTLVSPDELMTVIDEMSEAIDSYI